MKKIIFMVLDRCCFMFKNFIVGIILIVNELRATMSLCYFNMLNVNDLHSRVMSFNFM